MLRVFQSVRGLSHDSVTRLDKNPDLALEMRDLNRIALSSEFHAFKGRLPATPTLLKSTTFSFDRIGLENFEINPWCVGSLENSFGSDRGRDAEEENTVVNNR